MFDTEKLHVRIHIFHFCIKLKSNWEKSNNQMDLNHISILLHRRGIMHILRWELRPTRTRITLYKKFVQLHKVQCTSHQIIKIHVRFTPDQKNQFITMN